MNTHFTKIVVLAAAIGLVGCSTNTQNQNTAVGAVAGALLGGVIGHSMDSSDTNRTYVVLSHNRKGHASTWVNTKTGVRYTVVPVSGRMNIHGNPHCRKFRTTAVMNGKADTMYGYACYQGNGTWMTVNP